jgi:hypothetical protein
MFSTPSLYLVRVLAGNQKMALVDHKLLIARGAENRESIVLGTKYSFMYKNYPLIFKIYSLFICMSMGIRGIKRGEMETETRKLMRSRGKGESLG